MSLSHSENDLSVSSRFLWHVAHVFFGSTLPGRSVGFSIFCFDSPSFSAMKLYNRILKLDNPPEFSNCQLALNFIFPPIPS